MENYRCLSNYSCPKNTLNRQTTTLRQWRSLECERHYTQIMGLIQIVTDWFSQSLATLFRPYSPGGVTFFVVFKYFLSFFKTKTCLCIFIRQGALKVWFNQLAAQIFLLYSPGGATSFSSYFIVFVVLKMSPPKTPCFAPGPATQTSVTFLLKLLHRHAKQCLLCWFQAVLAKLGDDPKRKIFRGP